MRYERAFAHAASFALHGPWLSFTDANGPGYCQPDFLLRVEETPFCIEAKLTDVEGARKQLQELYLPVLERALGEPVCGVVLVRHLSALKECRQRYDVFDSLRAAVLSACAQRARLSIFHWRERTPLGLGSLVPQPPIPSHIPFPKLLTSAPSSRTMARTARRPERGPTVARA